MLTCADVHAPRHLNRAAEIRPLVSDRDWQQSVELTRRYFGEQAPQTQFSFARPARG